MPAHIVLTPRGRWTSNVISSTAEYGLIPTEEWSQPPHIDEHKAKSAREQMIKDNVIYGGETDLTGAFLLLIKLFS